MGRSLMRSPALLAPKQLDQSDSATHVHGSSPWIPGSEGHGARMGRRRYETAGFNFLDDESSIYTGISGHSTSRVASHRRIADWLPPLLPAAECSPRAPLAASSRRDHSACERKYVRVCV